MVNKKAICLICIVILLIVAMISLVSIRQINNDANLSNQDNSNDKLKPSKVFDNFSYNNSVVNGNFPSTYSFENDTINSNPDNFVITESPDTEINVISGIDNHSKIVNVSIVSGAVPTCYNSFSPIVFGTIEYWLWVNQINSFFGLKLYGRVPTGDKSRIGITNFAGVNRWVYDDSGFKILDLAPMEIQKWYHVKIDFECGNGQYKGLSPDSFRITINNNETDTGIFEFTGQDINRIYFWCILGTNNDFALYDSLGYSWDTQYLITDNNINLGNQIYKDSNSKSIGTFKVSIRDNLDKYMRLYLMNGNDKIISFKFHNSYFLYNDYQTWINNSIILDNSRKDIVIAFNCSINKYNIFLDDILLDSGLDFMQNTNKINKVLFESENRTSLYLIYITGFYFIDITITNPKAINYNTGLDGYYYGSYTFTYEVGLINTQIDLFEFHAGTGDSNAVVIENYTDSLGINHNQVVRCFDNDTTSEFRTGHIFDMSYIGSLEVYFLMNASTIDANTWFTLGFIQIFVDAGISINLTGNQEIHYQDTDGNFSYLCNFTFNQWYHLRFDFDVDNDWYLIYFDGNVYNISYWQNPSGLNTFGTISAHLGINQTLYLDAFGLTSLVDYQEAFPYNLTDNIETDLLLSFESESFMNDTIWYCINDGNNITIYGNHTFRFLPKGNYYIQVFCNDTNGILYKSDKIYFTILIVEIEYPPLPKREKKRDLYEPPDIFLILRDYIDFLIFTPIGFGILIIIIVSIASINAYIQYKKHYKR